MPPLPNTLYTRDTTCWLYGGLTMNPLYWPARKDETLIYKAIYEFHPDFVGSTVWWGDPEQEWGQATFEGGDVMPVGNGVVLVGMSERTSRQAITQVAAALFAQGAAEQVVVAGMPKLRAAMHLDTVFTFADRDIVTLYPTIMDAVHTFSLLPSDTSPGVEVVDEGSTPFVDVVARVARAAVVPGDRDRGRRLPVRAPAVGQRQQRRRPRAGRRLHLRPQHPDQHPAAQGRRRGHHDRRRRARPRPRRRPLHDLPDHPRPRRLLMRTAGRCRGRRRSPAARRLRLRRRDRAATHADDQSHADEHTVAAVADLDGTTYESTSVEGHELVPGAPVRVSFEDDTMSVSAGCNTMFGAFERDRGTLAWSGEPAWSLIGCEPELADQDAWLADLFTTGVEATPDGSTLTLTSADVVMEFADDGRDEPGGPARAHLDGAWDRRGRGHQPGARRGPQP